MYFLGVDVGGTKTHVLIVDHEGRTVAFQEGPGANYQGLGVEKAYNNLMETISKALEKASLSLQDIEAGFFGVAGADFDYEIKIVRTILDRIGLRRYAFDNDGRIALRSGTLDDVGILVSCGTGGINYACDGKRMERMGGFSEFFGERLGSYIIAGLVASSIVRGKDGRSEHTKMIQMFESQIGGKIEDIMHYEYEGDYEKMREYSILLIKTLFCAANQHDFVALKILCRIVDEVVSVVKAFRMKLDFTPPIKLVLEGSFFKNADPILLEMILSAVGPEYRIVVPKHPPVVGAVLLAAEFSNHKFDRHSIERLIGFWGNEP
ncbi:N-acetylglucosamine kinase [Pseudothermotoga sp.]|nr:ATPase [Pseudothermotoga sp.]MCX7813022.1 ATPase [Pseudothermotoga sp.]MDW8139739.1 BadF/BadG/BcrA/BcrD ATPase family protein [Pseudothermotoga sp.]